MTGRDGHTSFVLYCAGTAPEQASNRIVKRRRRELMENKLFEKERKEAEERERSPPIFITSYFFLFLSIIASHQVVKFCLVSAVATWKRRPKGSI